jgi:hypothetical protein
MWIDPETLSGKVVPSDRRGEQRQKLSMRNGVDGVEMSVSAPGSTIRY